MIIYFQTYGFIHYIVYYIYVYNSINFLQFIIYVLAVFLFLLSKISVLAGDIILAVSQLFDSSGIIQGQFYAWLCCTCFVSFASFESRKQSLTVLNFIAFPLFALGFKLLILCCVFFFFFLLCVNSFFLDIMIMLRVLCIIALRAIDVIILVRVVIMNLDQLQRTLH